MTNNDRQISKKKNKQIMSLEIFLLVLFTIAVVILVALIYKNVSRKEIEPQKNPPPDTSSKIEVIPEDAADLDILSQHFTYTSLDESCKGKGLIYLSSEPVQPGKGDLQPVYNAVFNKKGLQIASVKDSKMTCRSDMIIPLTDMLNDFYDETGLRTIMIENAFSGDTAVSAEPEEEPEQEFPDDGGFYDPDGNYITFGYTDEDGVYHDDGYYDSYGNYMGYGYYDEEGNYTPFEDMALAATEQQDINKTEKKKLETPACGEHYDGYSIDLGLYDRETNKTSEFDGSGKYKWFEENCWVYGFILRYPEGKADITGSAYLPNHFRYVGRTAAKVIHDNDLALEELSSFVSTYNYDSPLSVNSLDGTAIFYSIADSGLETTDIQIPTDSEGNPLPFQVSDTGDGRYVITVILPQEYVIVNGYTETEAETAAADSTAEVDESLQE